MTNAGRCSIRVSKRVTWLDRAKKEPSARNSAARKRSQWYPLIEIGAWWTGLAEKAGLDGGSGRIRQLRRRGTT